MTHALRRLLALLVIISVTSAACSTEGDSPRADGKSSVPGDGDGDMGGASGDGDGDGDQGTPLSPLEEANQLDVFASVDLTALTLDESVDALPDCTEIEPELLEGTEPRAGGLTILQTACNMAGQLPEVTVDGTEVESWILGPASIALLLPIGSVGTVEVTFELGDSQTSVEVAVAPEYEIENPREYVVGFIDEMLAAPADEDLGPLGAQQLEAAREAMTELSDEDVAVMAPLIQAVEDARILEEKAWCDSSSYEQQMDCYHFEVPRAAIRSALIFSIASGVCYLGFSPPTPWGAVACGVAVGVVLIDIKSTIDGNEEFMGDVVQPYDMDLSQELGTVDSGVETRWFATAQYTSIQDADAAGGNRIASLFEPAREIVETLNSVFALAKQTFDGPGLSSPATTAEQVPQAQFLSVSLALGAVDVDLDWSRSGTNLLITLTNSGAEPQPAELVFEYEFEGVQTMQEAVDVVVQPPDYDCDTDMDGTNDTLCEENEICWENECQVADCDADQDGEPDIVCGTDEVCLVSGNSSSGYAAACYPTGSSTCAGSPTANGLYAMPNGFSGTLPGGIASMASTTIICSPDRQCLTTTYGCAGQANEYAIISCELPGATACRPLGGTGDMVVCDADEACFFNGSVPDGATCATGANCKPTSSSFQQCDSSYGGATHYWHCDMSQSCGVIVNSCI